MPPTDFLDTLITAGPAQYNLEIGNLRRNNPGPAFDLLVAALDRLR